MKAITREEGLMQIYDKIKDIKFAMFTSLGEDGVLRSRPMSTTEAQHDGQLWFFTYDETEKTYEIEKQPRVNLAYADISNSTYVSVSGTARIVKDRNKMEKLWNPMFRAWFPKGLDQPGIALLAVSIEEAEFWDSSSSKMVQLFQMAKAILTGSQANQGEHKEIKIVGPAKTDKDKK
jgi:general stress protein 26